MAHTGYMLFEFLVDASKRPWLERRTRLLHKPSASKKNGGRSVNASIKNSDAFF